MNAPQAPDEATDSALKLIVPQWAAPANIGAASTTRIGGDSDGIFSSLNMGFGHDDDWRVLANRKRVASAAQIKTEARWIKQVHGARCVGADNANDNDEADACWTDSPRFACVIMTADCLPVLFCTRDGQRIGAAHAGWRGLASGVLESTLNAMAAEPADILAWLGPAISGAVYEVGAEVRDAFTSQTAEDAQYFTPTREGHWFADLPALARSRLGRAGVDDVSGGDWCTFSDPKRFYSYRRDGSTGRMATFIWRRS